MAAARKDRDLAAEIAFLTRALKAPTLREWWEYLDPSGAPPKPPDASV